MVVSRAVVGKIGGNSLVMLIPRDRIFPAHNSISSLIGCIRGTKTVAKISTRHHNNGKCGHKRGRRFGATLKNIYCFKTDLVDDVYPNNGL